MKKNMFYTAALLLAGAVMAACSGSEDITGNTTPEPKTSTAEGAVVLRGTLGSKGSSNEVTRVVGHNGTGSWVVGDQFAVYYQTANGHATAVATVNSVNDNGSANFTATLNKPKAGESEVTLVYPAWVHDGNGGIKDDCLAVQDGSSTANTNNLIDPEMVTTTLSVEEQEGKATLNSDVTMQPQAAYLTLALYKSDGTDDAPLTTKKLVISDGTHTYTINYTNNRSYYYRINVWPAENADYTFTATAQETTYAKLDGVTLANCGLEHIGCVFDRYGNIYSTDKGADVTYSASFSGKTLERGTRYIFNMTLTRSGSSSDVSPVAMIAYVGEAGSADASSSIYRGLAMAMSRCNNGNTSGYHPINTDASYHYCTQSSEYCTSSHTTDIAVAREQKDGISLTTQLIANSTGQHDHQCAKAARAYNVPTPAGCSDWFLASIGQWGLIMQGLITKQDGLSTLYSTPISRTKNSKMTKTYLTILDGHELQIGSNLNGTCSEGDTSCQWILNTSASVGRAVGPGDTTTKVKTETDVTVIPVLAF